MLKGLLCGVAAVLIAGSASAQITLFPRTIRLDAMTCQELLALPGEHRDRVLIYLNGYLDGTRRASTWDERASGERIDRVVAECKSRPETSVFRAFTDAWSR